MYALIEICASIKKYIYIFKLTIISFSSSYLKINTNLN